MNQVRAASKISKSKLKKPILLSFFKMVFVVMCFIKKKIPKCIFRWCILNVHQYIRTEIEQVAMETK
jgi:hypothetical protein